jgi:hypothetical protein
VNKVKTENPNRLIWEIEDPTQPLEGGVGDERGDEGVCRENAELQGHKKWLPLLGTAQLKNDAQHGVGHSFAVASIYCEGLREVQLAHESFCNNPAVGHAVQACTSIQQTEVLIPCRPPLLGDMYYMTDKHEGVGVSINVLH